MLLFADRTIPSRYDICSSTYFLPMNYYQKFTLLGELIDRTFVRSDATIVEYTKPEKILIYMRVKLSLEK